ncbi:MAG: glycosyltransferase family 4 protein [Clostridia bacterium]|nr:glycosyltransferase family 4 protein [Clostridia bacterium]
MKILFVCQYYKPEPFRHPDICEELVRQGNEVLVVTGTPNYPMGETYADYEHGKRKDEVVNGVRVHRCYTVPRKNNPVFRVLNYLSFVFFSTRYVKHIKENFDIVFVHQLSPVIMAKAGIKYKHKNNIPLVLYCLDLWPESAVMGGMKKGSLIYRFLHRISERIYKSADKILISSESFSGYFQNEFRICNTLYLPQYADDIFTPENCKKAPDENIDLMFAGNIGTAQDVDTIINAARLLSDIKNLKVHIVGDGSQLGRLKKAASDLPQVIFHGRQPLEKMPEYYAMADAMLITLRSGELNATLPGKVQTCLAAGKPIIAAADGETANAINTASCGYCSPAGDASALADSIRKYIENDKAGFSKNARTYYDKLFGKQAFVERLEKILEDLICNQNR